MFWIYHNGNLAECTESGFGCAIDIKTFEHLTGKKIDWNKREFQKVETQRVGGHVKAYDTRFIKGETYKYKYKVCKCEHVDADGLALLVPRGNALKAITAKDANDWEIV